ncbi:MAG TPA: gluconate 2-dehydrogenase subunit 3 family protein [Bryobacteraceae bacterium]|nr:gluconate 2-dehydrogenase subunit 3 family protein [Bryobacteraceae bacterium]
MAEHHNPERREALKIIGAISATCAFPFAGDELFGQQAGAVASPKFFTPSEFALVSRVADLIIPQTDTPGAVGAGVPAYIDYVVRSNERFQELFRTGLAWLSSQRFLDLSESQQIALLAPLADAVDRDRDSTPQEKFWRTIKGITADGYYTSKIGLVNELGYSGNMARAEFPGCHEH